MGNKDKAAVATKSQQKRIFNEHLYFSHPRLNAQTAAAFLQRERGRCCRDQGWFRDHPWETPPTSSSPRFSPRCPAPASEFRVTLAPEDGSETLWRHSQRLSSARKGCPGSWCRCWKAWASFPKDPNWKCSEGLPLHREWFASPRTTETPISVQMLHVLALFLWPPLGLARCTHREAADPGQTVSPLPPHLYLITYLEEIQWDIFWEPFPRDYYPIGMLFRKIRRISLRKIFHC